MRQALSAVAGTVLGCVAMMRLKSAWATTHHYDAPAATSASTSTTNAENTTHHYAAAASATTAPSQPLHLLPPRPRWRRHHALLADAYAWAKATVPYFECSDVDITTTYHYRWRVFHMHLKTTRRHGSVLTEFLRDVPWSGPYGTINCAHGHHAADGRWLRDPSILDNYSSFWFRHPKADLRYTWWPAWSAWERYRIDGRRSILATLYPHLCAEYGRWANRSYADEAKCAWQACHDDGEENSIGLDGCRPTINAALHGEATALASISAMLGFESAASLYEREARRWQGALETLWSAKLQFFVTRALPPPPGRRDDIQRRRTKVGCQYCTSKACPPKWVRGALVDVRELAGLSWPFYHRAAAAHHASAWRQLIEPDGFAAPWGVTTAERRHPCFNFSSWCQTSWNGPVWPFESSKVATALLESLHDPALRTALRERAGVTPSHFHGVLATFARMHTRGVADGAVTGAPFVGESFHPTDGYWLSRRIMFQRHSGDRRRGDHYLHSSFADVVLSGLVGLHVVLEHSTAALVVEPLFAADQLSWFTSSAMRIRGRTVDVAYDRDGSHHAGLVGLAVWVDGKVAAHVPAIGRLVIPLAAEGSLV